MARKPQENPALDMTPMIDVVFELIIFFVVTLTEAQKKDETIELVDGQHGVVLTADELPPQHMQIDIASMTKDPVTGKMIPKPRISMGDQTMSIADIRAQIKDRRERWQHDFPVLIRADYAVKHEEVKKVMDVCASEKIWQLSIMAVAEDKTKGDSRPRLKGRRK